MARSAELDPVQKFRFDVRVVAVSLASAQVLNNFKQGSITQFARIGFTKVDIPTQENAVIQYRENVDNFAFRKQPGLARFNNITLNRGVLSNFSQKGRLINQTKDFYRWVTRVNGFNPAIQLTSELIGFERNAILRLSNEYRKDLIIISRDREGKPARRWYVVNAFPITYSGGDGLDASSEENLIENLTLTYELAFELPSVADAAKEAVVQIIASSMGDTALADGAGILGDLDIDLGF
jgi:phage tail-like protein